MSEIKNTKYDLESRTAQFGEKVIKFVKKISKDSINNPLVSQIVRSGTSVGANYCEANSAGSKKEFVHRISICKRECKETQHWLRMIVVAIPEVKDDAKILWQEAQELVLIFSKILSSSRKNR